MTKKIDPKLIQMFLENKEYQSFTKEVRAILEQHRNTRFEKMSEMFYDGEYEDEDELEDEYVDGEYVDDDDVYNVFDDDEDEDDEYFDENEMEDDEDYDDEYFESVSSDESVIVEDNGKYYVNGKPFDSLNEATEVVKVSRVLTEDESNESVSSDELMIVEDQGKYYLKGNSDKNMYEKSFDSLEEAIALVKTSRMLTEASKNEAS